MTVSNTTAKLQYAGDGTTRTFGITFPLLSADHLRVVVTDASGTDTTITNNYTLSDELNSITYPTEASELDPLPEGYKITLIRQTPLTQQIDLHSAHALDAEELERGYDKLTLLVQELKEQLARCIQYAATNTTEHAAEQFLSDVETAASNAANSASAAASSATSAAGSATTASNAATQAGAAKDVATTAATTAGGYVTSAQTYAQTAATSAQTAAAQLTAHNTSPDAHADMRQEIAGKQAALPDGATGLFLRKTADGVDWAQPGGGGGGGGSVDWGSIGGTLSNQTDLKNVLDGKAAASHTHTKSEITDFPTIPSKVSDLTNDSGFITDVPVATTATAGKVKPDGTTITCGADGTLTAVGCGSGGGITATYDSTNKILTLE